MAVYTPIVATLGYVLSPDRSRVLLVHRNARPGDQQLLHEAALFRMGAGGRREGAVQMPEESGQAVLRHEGGTGQVDADPLRDDAGALVGAAVKAEHPLRCQPR